MQHTSHTPPPLDHVIAVIGHDRFTANFHKPIEEWDLTADECDRIAKGPHHAHSITLVETESFGFADAYWQVRCECGNTYTGRLYSDAIRVHEDHAHIAPISHVHTREILEG